MIDYFKNRSVVVKWHGKKIYKKRSSWRGPQGACIGNLEYKAQSNNNANCVAKDSRFKFVDDLTTLEKINLLLVGMASHNSKHHVTSEVNVSRTFKISRAPKQHSELDCEAKKET